MTNPFSWAVNQLANVQRVERKVPTFNPRPPGVIHAGSSSEAVLQILRAHPKVFFTHGKLMELTGKSHAAVSWALKYLRKQGLVKTIGDTARNERWLKYAAEIGAADVQIANKPRVHANSDCLVRDEVRLQIEPQPEVHEAAKHLEANSADLESGQNTAVGVGPAPWPVTSRCVVPPQARDADQRALFAADAQAPQDINPTLKAIAA